MLTFPDILEIAFFLFVFEVCLNEDTGEIYTLSLFDMSLNPFL